ncbi:MAG: hypothetical protein KC422_09235 [Trueperaceae bacterium]|nr:hypothetical protein [Trueperaceae bacterium]
MEKVEIGREGKPESDFPHTSTDVDVGNGVENRYLDTNSEMQARRDDIARKLEDALEYIGLLLKEEKSEDIRAVEALLEDAYELIGKPLEETDDETLSSTV